ILCCIHHNQFDSVVDPAQRRQKLGEILRIVPGWNDDADFEATVLPPVHLFSLEKLVARPVKNATLAGGQTADSGFGNFIENGIDGRVDIVRFDYAPSLWAGDDTKLGPWPQPTLKVIPPRKFRPGAAQFHEQKSRANACPNDREIAPSAIG